MVKKQRVLVRFSDQYSLLYANVGRLQRFFYKISQYLIVVCEPKPVTATRSTDAQKPTSNKKRRPSFLHLQKIKESLCLLL